MNRKIDKKLIWVGLILASLVLSFSGCTKKTEIKTEAPKQMWISPMHPWIKQDKPGDCPICGMPLVPMEQYQFKQLEKNKKNNSSEAPVVRLGEAKDSIASIKIATVEERKLEGVLEAFGTLNYIQDRHVDVTWYYALKVDKVLVDYNTTEVVKDQPILKVYSEEAVTEQEAYLEAIRQRWLSTFYERKVLSSKIEAIRSKLKRIGLSDQDLENLVKNAQVQNTFIIRAPIAGSIVDKFPHTGEWFDKNMQLFHLVPLDEMWFEADFYEKDMGALKLGQKATVITQAYPGKAFAAKLVFIDRKINPENRTLRVRFVLNNPQKILIPQLAGTVRVNLAEEQVSLVIPSSAVIDTGMRKVVYVLGESASYEMREISTGGISGDYVEVLSGLKAGERIAERGAFLLDAEAQLRSGSDENSESSTPVPKSATEHAH